MANESETKGRQRRLRLGQIERILRPLFFVVQVSVRKLRIWDHSFAPYWAVLGRACFSGIFLASAFSHVVNWEGTSGYMASKGVPSADFLLLVSIVILTLGGLSVLFGIYAKLGSIVLAAFLIPVTLIFHDFWSYEGYQRQLETIQFLKNLALIGGAMVIHRFGAGSFSLIPKR